MIRTVTTVFATLSACTFVALLSAISATAQAPTPIKSVWLQGTSPGTTQSGNTHIDGTAIAGSFQGDGAMLTSLDASNIASGTIADGRLSSNVPLLSNANAFAGTQNTFSGNVGIGVTTPVAPLEVQGEMIRTIVRAGGNGPDDNTDNGGLLSRAVLFTKRHAETGLRVTYSDNIRALNNSGGRWEIRFNAQSATPPVAFNYYVGSNQNVHVPTTMVGTANGLAAGIYVVRVYVGPAPGYPVSDLYTGWLSSTWSLEVEEVW